MFSASAPREYALAAYYANHLALIEGAAESELQKLIDEGTVLRSDLLSGAEVLVHFKKFDAQQLVEIRAGSGFLDLGEDLTTLGAKFIANWAQYQGQTPITREQAERAQVLGTKIHELLGKREVGVIGDGATDTANMRQRAWTLLTLAYDEVQRVVQFVRWHDKDADQFARTLYQRATSYRHAADSAPTPGAPATPAAPAASTNNAPTAVHAVAIPAAKDGGPFTS